MSSVCRSGKSRQKARGFTTAPERRCEPADFPFSTTAIGTSPRRSFTPGFSSRSCARRIAAASPAGPAPTTSAPTSIRSSGGLLGSATNSAASNGGGKVEGRTLIGEPPHHNPPERSEGTSSSRGQCEAFSADSSSPALPHELGQLRDDLVQVADDAEVAVLEDGRVRVLVHGHDRARALHAHLVLDRSGDAAGDVELRRDDLARLTHLGRVRVPAGVHDGAGGRDRAAERLRELLDEGEVLRLAEAAAAGGDDGGGRRRRKPPTPPPRPHHIHT